MVRPNSKDLAGTGCFVQTFVSRGGEGRRRRCVRLCSLLFLAVSFPNLKLCFLFPSCLCMIVSFLGLHLRYYLISRSSIRLLFPVQALICLLVSFPSLHVSFPGLPFPFGFLPRRLFSVSFPVLALLFIINFTFLCVLVFIVLSRLSFVCYFGSKP